MLPLVPTEHPRDFGAQSLIERPAHLRNDGTADDFMQEGLLLLTELPVAGCASSFLQAANLAITGRRVRRKGPESPFLLALEPPSEPLFDAQ